MTTTAPSTEAPAVEAEVKAPAPELTTAEVTKLRELTVASQEKGAGAAKVAARHELDLTVFELFFVKGVTLKKIADALSVTESSIHTRVTRIRRFVPAPVVEAAVEVAEAEAVAEAELITFTEAPAVEETPKQRKNRLARERRAAANARIAAAAE